MAFPQDVIHNRILNAQRRVKHALETSNIKKEIFGKLQSQNRTVVFNENYDNSKENISQEIVRKKPNKIAMLDVFASQKKHKLV